MGRGLVGLATVGTTRAGGFLGLALATEPKGDALAAGAVCAGVLSADCTGQRVALASALVRAHGLGRPAGDRPERGRPAQAVRLSRSIGGPQAGLVLTSDGPLARSVRRQFRGAVVRPDQHLFRERSAGRRPRQAPLRLFARSPQRLRASGDRADRDAGRTAVGVRGAARQYARQQHAARLPRSHRASVRQGQTHLGDGPRHPHRGGVGGYACQRPTGQLPRRHAQGSLEQARARPGRATLAEPPAKG